MSSPYPPGVTGNEPQIAGYDERERETIEACDNDDWDPKDGHPGMAVCGFNGPITVTEFIVYRTSNEIIGSRQWTCPRCGMVNEEDDVALEERDPDEGRD